jgi:hypothetical protein
MILYTALYQKFRDLGLRPISLKKPLQIGAMNFRLLSAFFIPVLVMISLGKMKAQGPDTLRVMNYNLTNYGNNIAPCTAANNGLTLKNPEFKTIMGYYKPDILGVCEMNTNPVIANSFLTNVLNTDGMTAYKRSNPQAEPSGTITSMLFYNSEKMTLAFQSYVNTSYRLTHHFRLFLQTTGLPQGDTIWLNVFACHLKAGNTTTDAADRASMTAAIRTYLQNYPKTENCLILGDFNVYRSSETAFQNLILPGSKPAYQFFDPINRIGSWGSNASFADVHTQCPRTDNNGGCYSGGGLDDRFDFILMNRHLINDSAGLRYAPGTYKALGNDGQHYNKSITASPVNNSVPAAVLNSLFKASDHLPVVAQLKVNGSLISGQRQTESSKLKARITIIPSGLRLEGAYWGTRVRLRGWDLSGKNLFDYSADAQDGNLPWSLFPAGKGPIFLRVEDSQGQSAWTRLFLP